MRAGNSTLTARLAVGFAALLITMAVQAGTVLYVDDDAPPGGDGLAWSTAHRFLQGALADAVAGAEIRVAQGTYLPDRDAANPQGTGDQEATFQHLNGVALMGGFAGLSGPDPDERDAAAYETTLSGDLTGNDGHYSGDNSVGIYNKWENSHHVVTGSGTGRTYGSVTPSMRWRRALRSRSKSCLSGSSSKLASLTSTRR
jgi:hypothetical protein